MANRFDNKVVLVTGGASGIGLATAKAFGREGAKVVVADINEQGAADAAATIERSGGQATSVRADVSDFAACVAMVEHAVSHFGGLHVAFNNAGVGSIASPEFEDIRIEDWHRVMNANLNGVFYSIKAEIPAMRKSGGTAIVNTASAASFIAAPSIASYMTSKHGVAGLTKCAALDLIRHGIRVNAICPGSTETGMTAPRLRDPKAFAAMVALSPISRFAKPEEMAEAVLFLASDEASYMVGSLMRVDGGMTLR